MKHLDTPLREAFGTEVVLDGELYVHGWPLQRILSAVTPVATMRGPSIDTLLVEYHVFDVVDYTQSFNDRRRWALGKPAEWLEQHKLVETRIASNEQEAEVFYADFVSAGYEGMIYRLGDCPYTVPKQQTLYPAIPGCRPPRSGFLSDKNNRCWQLLKRKDWQDAEFICDGFNLTTGELGETGFQLWCTTDHSRGHKLSGKHFAVSSGLTNFQRDHYAANPPIGHEIKVKFLTWSTEGAPQNATIHPDHIVK